MLQHLCQDSAEILWIPRRKLRSVQMFGGKFVFRTGSGKGAGLRESAAEAIL